MSRVVLYVGARLTWTRWPYPLTDAFLLAEQSPAARDVIDAVATHLASGDAEHARTVALVIREGWR